MADFYATYPAGSAGGGGGGSVNSVTATVPLFSSGGANPNITIQVATALEPGYLSAADWTTFNSKQNALTFGNLTDVGTDGIVVTGGAGAVIGAGTSLAQHVADTTHNGYLSSADWNTFNTKQAALTFGNLTGPGLTVTGGTGAVIGAGAAIAFSAQNDIWVSRFGTDTAGAGTFVNPCQTVGFALTLISAPGSTNDWAIHLMTGRHDQEVGDLLLPIYTWIVGSGGPDVGSYLRLPAGKAIKQDATWAAGNGRGGIQSVYLGGGTNVNLDFAAGGGAEGSEFIFDDCTITGTFNHTGRGVNGGDFLTLQDTLIFGAATFTGDEVTGNVATFESTATFTSSATVNCDSVFLASLFVGAVSITQTGTGATTYQSSASTYQSTFTTVGTVGLTVDAALPIGYSLSGGTTVTYTTNANSLSYTPAVSGNWSPVPTLVAPALDQLAARTAGAGTVSSVSVVSANGLAGTVATATTTPAITLSTTITGILQGNGTAISAATIGNLTDVGTDGITVTNGANAVLGTGTSLSQHVADTTHNGYLSSADWNTFNGKGSGSVTSVGLSDGSSTPIYTIGGTPVTGGGTLTFTLNTESANLLFAGPVSGVAAQPTFRSLVVADLPAGTGTVTFVSVVTANGFAGTVATATTTPAITLTTSITGILQGNGTAISAATTGNLTDAGTDGIVVTNGSGAVLGTGTSIAQHVADTTHNGYLSSADWNTFNGKGSGTVTSVVLTVPGIMSVAGSPITTSGTLAVTLATQTANTVWAGPASGAAATPTFRALTVADETIAAQAISATTIDWSTGYVFTQTLTGNTTFTFANQLSGQTIVVRLTNTGSNFTVTWPTVRWAGGTAPTMSPGAVSDVYTLVFDGANTYGSVVANMS